MVSTKIWFKFETVFFLDQKVYFLEILISGFIFFCYLRKRFFLVILNICSAFHFRNISYTYNELPHPSVIFSILLFFRILLHFLLYKFLKVYLYLHMASLVAQLVKNPPAMRETWARSLGWEDPLEKGKATHSSILAWRIPWTV